MFVEVFNTLVKNKDYFLDKWKGLRESDNPLRRYKTKQFRKIITEAEPINEFDTDLYFALVEIMIDEDGRLMVSLLDGTEIEINI